MYDFHDSFSFLFHYFNGYIDTDAFPAPSDTNVFLTLTAQILTLITDFYMSSDVSGTGNSCMLTLWLSAEYVLMCVNVCLCFHSRNALIAGASLILNRASLELVYVWVFLLLSSAVHWHPVCSYLCYCQTIRGLPLVDRCSALLCYAPLCCFIFLCSIHWRANSSFFASSIGRLFIVCVLLPTPPIVPKSTL